MPRAQKGPRMTTTERFERIEANLDRVTQVTATIAAAVAAHDEQIENLIRVAEIQQTKWEQLQREWQAYLTTIHPRQ
jgi:hypothetical protein